jgi:hypothetical protein
MILSNTSYSSTRIPFCSLCGSLSSNPATHVSSNTTPKQHHSAFAHLGSSRASKSTILPTALFSSLWISKRVILNPSRLPPPQNYKKSPNLRHPNLAAILRLRIWYLMNRSALMKHNSRYTHARMPRQFSTCCTSSIAPSCFAQKLLPLLLVRSFLPHSRLPVSLLDRYSRHAR